MELYLTSKFYKKIEAMLKNIHPSIRFLHRTRKKIADIYWAKGEELIEKEEFKRVLKQAFDMLGIDVSFRV